MKQYPKAAEGLKLMFYGELLAIIGILLTIILIGPIIALVGEILVLVGLYRARMDDEGYGTAFMLSIVNIVLSIVGLFVPSDGLLGSLLSIISTIISLAIIYFVCSTTGNLLLSQGESALAQRGQTVLDHQSSVRHRVGGIIPADVDSLVEHLSRCWGDRGHDCRVGGLHPVHDVPQQQL